MTPLIEKIRKKLYAYGRAYIDAELLEKILLKFAPNYTISQLCSKWLITPIKRGKWYLNNESKVYIDPYIVGALYMGENLYMFGWLAVYNLYTLSTQVADWQTIYNTKISGQKKIGNIKLLFVRQRENFFYGIEEKKKDGHTYKIMSSERALIELVKEKKTFASVPYGISPEKLKKLTKNHASHTIYTIIEKICSSKK